MVTVTFGLLDEENRGTQVRVYSLLAYDNLTIQQWRISHLGGDQYKIQNVDFETFISHDPRPQVDDPVLGKRTPIQWIMQLVQSPNIYT